MKTYKKPELVKSQQTNVIIDLYQACACSGCSTHYPSLEKE